MSAIWLVSGSLQEMLSGSPAALDRRRSCCARQGRHDRAMGSCCAPRVGEPEFLQLAPTASWLFMSGLEPHALRLTARTSLLGIDALHDPVVARHSIGPLMTWPPSFLRLLQRRADGVDTEVVAPKAPASRRAWSSCRRRRAASVEELVSAHRTIRAPRPWPQRPIGIESKGLLAVGGHQLVPADHARRRRIKPAAAACRTAAVNRLNTAPCGSAPWRSGRCWECRSVAHAPRRRPGDAAGVGSTSLTPT